MKFFRDRVKRSDHVAAERVRDKENYIKVAVIDSGVFPWTKELKDIDVVGESFIEDSIRSEDIHWHSPQSEHGTVIASLICRMNPFSKIFAAKVKAGKGLGQLDTSAAAQVSMAIICFPIPISKVKYKGTMKLTHKLIRQFFGP